MKLIDKDALVAEIKRRKELVSNPILLDNDLMIGERNAYFRLLSFINTLEVKEVNSNDAFIEKAAEWLRNNLKGIVGGDIYIEDFVKFMKEE